MAKYVMIGSGGHARVLADALSTKGIALAAVASPERVLPKGMFAGLNHFRSDDDLLAIDTRDVLLVNGVGSVGNPAVRREIYEKFRAAGFVFATVVHVSAVVSADVEINEGAQVMAGAVIQSGAWIGPNCIINTGAVVDHDCRIGAHTHIAPRACLAGEVSIGGSAHVGAGATVIQGKTIGDSTIVAAGAVVISDVPAGVKVVGVPARQIEPSA